MTSTCAAIAGELLSEPPRFSENPWTSASTALWIDDDLRRVEGLVGGHRARHAAAAAHALREDGDAVLAGRADKAVAGAVSRRDADGAAVAARAAIAADPDRNAFQRAADRSGHRTFAAAAADALREDADSRDALGQDRSARAVDDGHGSTVAAAARLAAHADRGLHRLVVGRRCRSSVAAPPLPPPPPTLCA